MIIQGDAFTELQKLESETVDCCITSPPYWALRDYKTTGQIWGGVVDCVHEWETNIHTIHSGVNKIVDSKPKNNQKAFSIKDKPIKTDFCYKCNAWRGSLGLEPTFQLYIEHLVSIFDEVRRVLKKTGSCWIVMGDTYAGTGKDTNRDPKYVNGRNTKSEPINNKVDGIPRKSLCNIPQRFSIAMVDRGGWINRNEIIWQKPNTMPSPATDRFTVDFEHVYLFTKSQKYFFETQYEPMSNESTPKYGVADGKFNSQEYAGRTLGCGSAGNMVLGRIKRCVWRISTKPFSGAHFAVFPPELIKPMIKAGCPEYICNNCGTPRMLEYEEKTLERYELDKNDPRYRPTRYDKKYKGIGMRYHEVTNGRLLDCGCNAGFHSGTVLDPFMGAGTTGMVALQNARDFIGIELNPEYIQLAKKRLDPWLKQERLVLEYL